MICQERKVSFLNSPLPFDAYQNTTEKRWLCPVVLYGLRIGFVETGAASWCSLNDPTCWPAKYQRDRKTRGAGEGKAIAERQNKGVVLNTL